jgi:wyosine [tRNA(Phe)-imidazoG37] synthetase (radical SAM superfamily)
MLLELQKRIVYGPVKSRRLGNSLGINILPPHKKVCTFNCQYCQYGWTEKNFTKKEKPVAFPSVENILNELEKILNTIDPKPAYLTFSGNGEPTLHPQLPEIISGVIFLRDKLTPYSKTAIFSNSTTLNHTKVKKALEKLDLPIMKLDAGNQQVFSKYNDPVRSIDFESIVKEMANLNKITIQALFSKGENGNFQKNHILAWIEKIKEISPDIVQLYTLDRNPPTEAISPVTKEELFNIHSLLEREKILSMIF